MPKVKRKNANILKSDNMTSWLTCHVDIAALSCTGPHIVVGTHIAWSMVTLTLKMSHWHQTEAFDSNWNMLTWSTSLHQVLVQHKHTRHACTERSLLHIATVSHAKTFLATFAQLTWWNVGCSSSFAWASSAFVANSTFKSPIHKFLNCLVICSDDMSTAGHLSLQVWNWNNNVGGETRLDFMDDFRLAVFDHGAGAVIVLFTRVQLLHRFFFIQVNRLVIPRRRAASVALRAVLTRAGAKLDDILRMPTVQHAPTCFRLDIRWNCHIVASVAMAEHCSNSTTRCINAWCARLSLPQKGRCERLHGHVCWCARSCNPCLGEVICPSGIWAKSSVSNHGNDFLQGVHWAHRKIPAVEGIWALDSRRVPAQDSSLLPWYFCFRCPAERSSLEAVAAQTRVIASHKGLQDVRDLTGRQRPLHPVDCVSHDRSWHQRSLHWSRGRQSACLSVCNPRMHPWKLRHSWAWHQDWQQQRLLLDRPCCFVEPRCHLDESCPFRDIMQNLMDEIQIRNSASSIKSQQQVRSNASVDFRMHGAICYLVQQFHFFYRQWSSLSARRSQWQLNLCLPWDPSWTRTGQSVVKTHHIMWKPRSLYEWLWTRGRNWGRCMAHHILPNIAFIKGQKCGCPIHSMPSVKLHQGVGSFQNCIWGFHPHDWG